MVVNIIGLRNGVDRGKERKTYVTYLAGAFLATCDPMEGRSSRTVFKE